MPKILLEHCKQCASHDGMHGTFVRCLKADHTAMLRTEEEDGKVMTECLDDNIYNSLVKGMQEGID